MIERKKESNNINKVKCVIIKDCKLVNVNPRSVVIEIMYSGERKNVYATRKIANELLRDLRCDGVTELNKFFIVEKNDNFGNKITWLAMPSIFG